MLRFLVIFPSGLDVTVAHRRLRQTSTCTRSRSTARCTTRPERTRTGKTRHTLRGMKPTIEKISAITLHVSNMEASVQFYRDLLGLELLYGGERSSFSSLRAGDSGSAILILKYGHVVPRWGRIIFHVADVDAFWSHLRGNGFDPEIPRDASLGRTLFPRARSRRQRTVVCSTPTNSSLKES